MAKPIYVVGGSKGGVGKSLVAMALTHLLSEKGEKVFVIDADTSNPDVFKSYGSEVTCELVNLDDASSTSATRTRMRSWSSIPPPATMSGSPPMARR
jgi:Mrp family chromosome partitioning ATPase